VKPAELIARLELEPLADEGGLYRQTYRDAYSTAIYFLVLSDDFSALHRLAGTEIYHFYGGDPLRMLLLHPDGRIERPLLGPELSNGEIPQLAVPGGVWQGSATTGSYSLLGTTMAPGFRLQDFELGQRAELMAVYPTAADDIARLTRDSPRANQ
jgi:uncharacterized protein